MTTGDSFHQFIIDVAKHNTTFLCILDGKYIAFIDEATPFNHEAIILKRTTIEIIIISLGPINCSSGKSFSQAKTYATQTKRRLLSVCLPEINNLCNPRIDKLYFVD